LGHRYLLEENYEEAILSFEKAISVEAKNPLGYIGSAMADMGLEKPKEAVAVLERGLDEIAVADDEGEYGADDEDVAGGETGEEASGDGGTTGGEADGEDDAGADTGSARETGDGRDALLAMLDLIESGAYSFDAAEQIWQDTYAVWTGSAPPDADAETIAETDMESASEQTDNLTGQPPLSLDDLAEWGFPWGVTIDELVGKHGIMSQDAEALSVMKDIDGWAPGSDDYGAVFEANTRRFIYAGNFEGGKIGPRGIRIGMTLDEAVNLFAVSNPDILEFAKDPTYENMRKYVAMPDEFGSLIIEDLYEFENTDQYLSVSCNNNGLFLDLQLILDTSWACGIKCIIENEIIQNMYIEYSYDLY
jgi:hypothetical protein